MPGLLPVLPRHEVTSPGAYEDGLDSGQFLDLHGNPCTGAGRPRSRTVCRSQKPGQLTLIAANETTHWNTSGLLSFVNAI